MTWLARLQTSKSKFMFLFLQLKIRWTCWRAVVSSLKECPTAFLKKLLNIDITCASLSHLLRFSGSDVVISTSRRMGDHPGSMTSAPAAFRSITACRSSDSRVRCRDWGVGRVGVLIWRVWQEPGISQEAGTPSSIALTAKCIPLAFKQGRSPCMAISSNFDLGLVVRYSEFWNPEATHNIVFLWVLTTLLQLGCFDFFSASTMPRYSVKKDLNCTAQTGCEYLPREVHQSFAEDPEHPLHLINHNNSAKVGFRSFGWAECLQEDWQSQREFTIVSEVIIENHRHSRCNSIRVELSLTRRCTTWTIGMFWLLGKMCTPWYIIVAATMPAAAMLALSSTRAQPALRTFQLRRLHQYPPGHLFHCEAFYHA